MTFTELNLHYKLYRDDHSRGHLLCEACRTYAKQVVGENNPDRQEIVADSTKSAWEHFATLPQEKIFAAWFTRIVRNKISDYRRRSLARARSEGQADLYPPPPFSLQEQQQMKEAGNPLVNLLLDGHTLYEAAEVLDISVRTAKNRLKRLREELNKNA